MAAFFRSGTVTRHYCALSKICGQVYNSGLRSKSGSSEEIAK